MARTYHFNGQVFHGFDKDFSTPHRLVLVQGEDTIDVWTIDEMHIEVNIKAFLTYVKVAESWCKIIGTYSEEGFRGFKCDNNLVSDKSRFK